uniref:Uncharacterized protein n=1 Tax=Arundo donax TaxID=35708 RepID=A0A0A8ZFL9_ARUDO
MSTNHHTIQSILLCHFIIFIAVHCFHSFRE